MLDLVKLAEAELIDMELIGDQPDEPATKQSASTEPQVNTFYTSNT